jgi:purine-binding chemotaxis protein CheW
VDGARQLLLFQLDEQRFALDLTAVERVLAAVDITALPHCPPIILGIINIQGRIVPVADMRARFRLPPRPIVVTDHIILSRSTKRPVALLVDGTQGTADCAAEDIVAAGEILPHLAYLEGVAKLGDGTTFIHNLDSLLSLDEETALTTALYATDAG